MTKAVGYIRVSTEEQTLHGYSLEAQAQAIKKYCELQGWELVRIYRDDGYSGASMERPDLQQFLEDVYLRKFDVVVVWKLDRLSRNLKDTLYLLDDALEKNGIGFISIQEQFDTTTPIGKAVMQIIAVFAQLEREMITERMKMGKYQKARLGQFPGGHVLYGYRKNPQTGEFEINEEEARIVRLIYHWYVYGDESGQPLGMEAIADKLTNMGILPPSAVRGVRVGVRGKRGQKGEYVKHWSNATVRQILTHQAYIGKNYFGRDGKNAEPEYTKDDWIPIPFPQIIDDHIYQLAQERRKRAKFWQRTHETPLLTGIIHCGICGLQFRGTYDHGTTAVYSCYGRLKRYHRDGSPTCDSPRIPADWLDQQVVLKVFEALQKPEQMKEAIMAHLESWERRKRELELLVGPSVKQMKELQDEQERLNYLFRKGRISVSEYEKEASALDKKIAELREQHKHQTNELRHLQKLEKDLDFIKQAIENGYWKAEYEALQSEIKMIWDAALTINNKTGEVVITTPRQEKKVTIDFSEAGKQVQEQEELLTFAIHGGGKIATRQLFDRLHITVHVYHDRVEVRGLIPIGSINISSFLPLLSNVFRVEMDTISLIMSATFVPLTIIPIVSGFILNFFSPKKMIFFSALIHSISVLTISFSQIVQLVIFLRFIEGFLISIILTSNTTYISLTAKPEKIQFYMSYYIAFTTIGGLLGRVIGSTIATFLGWQACFQIMAVSLLIVLPVVYYFLDDVKIPKTEETCLPLKKLKAILLDVINRKIYIMIFCLFFVFPNFIKNNPEILRKTLSFNKLAISNLINVV